MKTFLVAFVIAIVSQQSYSQKNNVIDSTSFVSNKSKTIKIRFGGTYTNANNPLFILDGVAINQNDLLDISPDDIVSISVLKDGSVLFCDGDAKNGIVLITTKNHKTPIVKKKKYAFKTYEICEDNWNTIQDVYNDIQAKVPGISITANNNLNQAPNIRMRGDNNTIVIVDGIRYDASILNTLNPADIESVTVAPGVAASNYLRNGFRN